MLAAFCGASLYYGREAFGLGSGARQAEVRVSLRAASKRRLHGEDIGNGTMNYDIPCYDGLTAAEVVERDRIGPFQVLTQKKYMLTIYGCAAGETTETNRVICLRDGYMWMVPVYIIGILYMFAGLAIICDEFFVPALELFTEELGLTPDVAGATFMAAGGSMPELFTSFIGTFNETDVGFAAIIGSAVFNVLFVIAVCTLASKEPLDLTWFPLFRDVTWYLLALTLVAIVFKASSPNRITSAEAVLLFCCYCGYCTFMKFNPQIEKFAMRLAGSTKICPVEETQGSETDPDVTVLEKNNEVNFVKPSTFRAGILQMLTQNASLAETAGITAVSQIKGNLRETFEKFDKDADDLLNEAEVGDMLGELGMTDRSASAFKQLKNIEPRKGDGSITFEAFQKWYLASEARVAIEVRRIFDMFDEDSSGTIDAMEIGNMLRSLGHTPSSDEIRCALEEMYAVKTDDPEKGDCQMVIQTEVIEKEIRYDKFEKWYCTSMFWQELHNQHVNEANADSEGFCIDMPKDGSRSQMAWFVITYPVAAMMYCTMPDVRREGAATFRVAILEFVCSLAWIAVFSLCLYDWLVTVSNTVGFPPEVAAVTILAGGTSIPDLLSSYVVARQGHGDMAVSSSIGSNIFDVTVGLPIPWLAYTLMNGRDVQVMSDSLFSSIIILILMLTAVIATVMMMNWRMTKSMGAVMMSLYVFFIIQQMLQDFNVISFGI